MKNYGYIISQLRKQKGLTQDQLGKRLNVSYQAISKWENNLSEPDLETLEKLTEIFEISMSDFFALANEGETQLQSKNKQIDIKEEEKTSKNFIKTKPWILVAGLSVLALVLLFVAIFVPFRLSAEAIYNKVNPSVFYVKTQTVGGNSKTGTGFFINGGGLAVVDYDVVEDCESGYIKFSDDKTYNIKCLVGVDEELDVAIIQIDIKNSVGVSAANSNKVSIAEKVYTIGYSSSTESSLAETMISKVNYSDKNRYFQILTTSARDGSVLVNEQGKVVGMISDGYYGDAGMDVAIPINEILAISKDINVPLKGYAANQNGIFKIEFVGNGATSGTMTSQEVIRDFYVGLSKNQFAREGYQFSGWSWNGNLYEDEQRIYNLASIGQTISFNAVWTPVVYTIKYQYINTADGQEHLASYTVEDEDITLMPTTQKGYEFKGWYEDQEFTKPISTVDTQSMKNYVLYPKFELATYTITYQVENGENNALNTITYTMLDDNFPLNNPTKTESNFQGWTLDGEVITIFDTSICENVTLIGTFVDQAYYIWFNTKSGSLDVSYYTYTYYTEVDLANFVPEKEGYAFVGWYEDSSYSGQLVEKIPFHSTGVKELYAKYNAIEYPIIYHLDGGEIISQYYPTTYTVEQSVSLPSFVNKEGFEFLGWYDAETEGNKVVILYAGRTGEKHYYARYEITTDDSGNVLISSPEAFAKLTEQEYWTKNIILQKDLDMSGVKLSSSIGVDNSYVGYEFSGTIEGNGYTISNLASSTFVFDNLDGATITNLHFKNLTIETSGEAGLIGYAYNATITNCSVQGTYNVKIYSDSPSKNIGGFASQVWLGNISSCSSDVDINIGCSISSSSGVSVCVGGFIGYADANIEDCYSSGDISIIREGGYLDDIYAGGFCGENFGNVTSCYSSSNVNVEKIYFISIYHNFYIAGFCGLNGSSAVMSGSYCQGDVVVSFLTATEDSDYVYICIDNFVGNNASESENCYYYSGQIFEVANYESTPTEIVEGAAMEEIWEYICAAWDADVWNLYADKNPTLKCEVKNEDVN